MKVSVITTAYNHQKTIDRAIKSVKDQSFKDYEHIIIDDTDTKNGMMNTYREAFRRCKGEYIAFCDGDDYWVHPHKLEMQVEYLDQNPDCGLCITKVFTEVDDKRENMKVNANFVNENMSFDNLLKGNAYIHAQSYMIRKKDFDNLIDFDSFMKFNVWDYPIVLELIQFVKFHCLDVYTAVYTKNNESVTNSRSRSERLKYVLGNYKIKLHYISKYGCKLSTKTYLVYRFTRDIYSIIFKRWYK